MYVWRLSRTLHADAPLSGTGAKRFGNRWNSKGTAVAYTSTTRALAVLEMLVHLDPEDVPGDVIMIPVNVPDGEIETLRRLPRRWYELPYRASVQRVGDQWVRSGRALGLLVPSAVLRAERNLLINPAHPAFGRVKVGKPEAFHFDLRLMTLSLRARAGPRRAGRRN